MENLNPNTSSGSFELQYSIPDFPSYALASDWGSECVDMVPIEVQIRTKETHLQAGRRSMRWTTYALPLNEELRPRLNQVPGSDPTCKLQMGDVVELTPAIPDKSLTEYREKIQCMYDCGRTVLSVGSHAKSMVGWRR